jgi:CheY-specific phosphatase CheX
MYRKILFETASRIFEDAAFVLVDNEDGAEGSAGFNNMEVPPVCSAIRFNGPFGGILSVATSRKLAELIAANMLGTKEDDAEVELKYRDALNEILNMICGNLVSEIAGAEPEFRISAPLAIEHREFEQMVRDHFSGLAYRIRLVVEGHETEIALLLAGEVKAGAAHD